MDWQQVIQDTWQTTLVFFTLLFLTRILGKTQVGQLTFYEYVIGITIGSVAANIVADEPEKVWSHFYDLFLFVILAYAISHVTMISRPLRKIIEGTPTVLIQDGHILRENMKSLRYDLDELTAQLREKSILDISEVQYAVLENNGTLSVIKKAAQQPVTRADLQLKNTPDPKYPVELIMDGEVIEDNFSQKRTREWLMQQLQTQGFNEPSAVMYAVVDTKGDLFVSAKKKSNS